MKDSETSSDRSATSYHSGRLNEAEENSIFSDLAAWLEKKGLQNSALYDEVKTAIKNEHAFQRIIKELDGY